MRFIRIMSVSLILISMCLVMMSAGSVKAQSGEQVRLGELERRATIVDSEASWTRGEIAKLSDRIARVEAMGQSNNTLLLAVLASLGALLIERAIRIGKRAT